MGESQVAIQRLGTAAPRHAPTAADISWFRRRLRTWFRANRRDFPWRISSDPYVVTIAEVFLQQTAAPKAAAFLHGFLLRYPGWEALAGADISELESTLFPLGLQRRRSRALLSLAKAVLDRGGLPESRQELETLPGVGQYIASALLTITRRAREPLLDTNMARVLERFFGPRSMSDIRYDPYLQQLSRRAVGTKDSLQLNWAVLDFAAAVCTARNPDCPHCSLLTRCTYARNSYASPQQEE